MLLIQELTTALVKDQYSLLLDSPGGDRFPIAAVYLCKARCCEGSSCTARGLNLRLHASQMCNMQPAIKHRAVFRRCTSFD